MPEQNGGHVFGLGMTLGRIDQRLSDMQGQLRHQRRALQAISDQLQSTSSRITATSAAPETLTSKLNKGDLKSIAQVIGLVVVVVVTSVAQVNLEALKQWLEVLLK
ncbi:MAG: hypothetical protein KKA81_16540 [Bacteroidetes bacterium]|nr:hypothetical protein [Bacteroidota bacterium]